MRVNTRYINSTGGHPQVFKSRLRGTRGIQAYSSSADLDVLGLHTPGLTAMSLAAWGFGDQGNTLPLFYSGCEGALS